MNRKPDNFAAIDQAKAAPESTDDSARSERRRALILALAAMPAAITISSRPLWAASGALSGASGGVAGATATSTTTGTTGTGTVTGTAGGVTP